MEQKLKSVGQSFPKPDAVNKVLGAAQYAADVRLPGTLVGKVLVSTYPHARIVALDTSEAEALPGVKAVVSARDVPDFRSGIVDYARDQPLLARDRVRFVGEPVAAVAAVDERTALEALNLIRVDYEELPAIFDAETAMQPGAKELHDRNAEWRDQHPPNVASFTSAVRGDVDAALAEADFIYEDEFRTQMQHQAYTEPISVLASCDRADNMTIWVCSKAIFRMRQQVSEYLGMPRSKIRVIATQMGGSFGAKARTIVEPIAAALSRKARRPVRITLTRYEDFTMGTPRHAAVLRLKTGVKRDGTVVGREATMVYDTGAYATLGPQIAAAGVEWVGGPYRLPAYRAISYCVYSNRLPCGAFRGFGTPQINFAVESQMDMIAGRLGMDPLEIRLKNAAEDGWIAPNGQRVNKVGLTEALKRVVEASGYGTRALPPNRALGIAALVKHGGALASSADVRLQDDGTLQLELGAIDCGQGSDMVLGQIAAEVVGIPFDQVKVTGGDTDTSPYDWNTAASRLTVVAGTAVRKAGEDLRGKILDHAAHALETAADDLEIEDGVVQVRGAPERRITLQRIGWESYWKDGGPINGHGSVLMEGLAEDPPECGGMTRGAHVAISFGAQVVETEVDPETGHVRAVKVWSAHDVGRAINPMAVEGQIEGGIVQAIGYSLSEDVVLEDGAVKNSLLNDYLVPLPPDAPDIEAIVLEIPDPESPGPFGAKPIGEHSLQGIPSCIAQAIETLTGGRLTSLPFTPEKVLAASTREVGDLVGASSR